MAKPIDTNKLMKCNHPIWSPVCSFHYNGECLRDHDYECPALMEPEIKTSNKVETESKLKEKKPTRLIGAEELKQDVKEWQEKLIETYGINDEFVVCLGRVLDKIDNAPTIEERKKGKWILAEDQRQEDMDNGNYRYFCSECGKGEMHSKIVTVSYCWNCGAEMEKDDEV